MLGNNKVRTHGLRWNVALGQVMSLKGTEYFLKEERRRGCEKKENPSYLTCIVKHDGRIWRNGKPNHPRLDTIFHIGYI